MRLGAIAAAHVLSFFIILNSTTSLVITTDPADHHTQSLSARAVEGTDLRSITLLVRRGNEKATAPAPSKEQQGQQQQRQQQRLPPTSSTSERPSAAEATQKKQKPKKRVRIMLPPPKKQPNRSREDFISHLLDQQDKQKKAEMRAAGPKPTKPKLSEAQRDLLRERNPERHLAKGEGNALTKARDLVEELSGAAPRTPSAKGREPTKPTAQIVNADGVFSKSSANQGGEGGMGLSTVREELAKKLSERRKMKLRKRTAGSVRVQRRRVAAGGPTR